MNQYSISEFGMDDNGNSNGISSSSGSTVQQYNYIVDDESTAIAEMEMFYGSDKFEVLQKSAPAMGFYDQDFVEQNQHEFMYMQHEKQPAWMYPPRTSVLQFSSSPVHRSIGLDTSSAAAQPPSALVPPRIPLPEAVPVDGDVAFCACTSSAKAPPSAVERREQESFPPSDNPKVQEIVNPETQYLKSTRNRNPRKHSLLEKHRRDTINSNLDDLFNIVPYSQGNKATKIEQATKYIKSLQQEVKYHWAIEKRNQVQGAQLQSLRCQLEQKHQALVALEQKYQAIVAYEQFKQQNPDASTGSFAQQQWQESATISPPYQHYIMPPH